MCGGLRIIVHTKEWPRGLEEPAPEKPFLPRKTLTPALFTPVLGGRGDGSGECYVCHSCREVTWAKTLWHLSPRPTGAVYPGKIM